MLRSCAHMRKGILKKKLHEPARAYGAKLFEDYLEFCWTTREASSAETIL